MSEATLTQKRPLPLNLLISAFVLVWVVLAAFPFVWTVWGSFKVEPDFFSRESWWNAIAGTYTQIQTGAAFTGDGYYGAWVTREFWRAVGNTAIVRVTPASGIRTWLKSRIRLPASRLGMLASIFESRRKAGTPLKLGTEMAIWR